MARPHLRPEDRRDERLPTPRVTAAERVEVEEKAAAAGISLTEFGRQANLNARITPRRGSIDEALLVELNRIGVNLNQIAMKVNAGRSLGVDFPAVVKDLRATLKKVLDGS